MSAIDIYDSEVKNHTGTGIYASYSDLLAEGCSVKDNDDGGVACLSFCLVEIKQSKICSNKVAGIYLDDSLETTITNNWICDNLRVDPYDYAGIYLNGPISQALIRNNTVCKNEPYGIYLTSGGTEPEVVNCILYYNTTTQIYTGSGQPPLQHVTYSCIQNGYDGEGNIDSDPLFLDAATGDYHLTKESGCVDTGYPDDAYTGETDIDGNPRVMGGRVDIGGDEDFKHCFPKYEHIYDDWVLMGRPNCWCYLRQCHGDADNAYETTKTGKYYVHFNDLNLLLANWNVKGTTMPVPGICADFAHDTETTKTGTYRVHFNDLNILLASWNMQEPLPYPNCVDCPQGLGEQQKEKVEPLKTEQLIKWLEQLWLDEEAQKLIDEDMWLKFIDSLKEEL
jgi:hypothetical protein